MRLLTWNIQGGGGRRIPSIVGEIAQLQPDVVGLTEVTFGNLEVLRLSLAHRGFEHIATTCSAGNANSVLVASKLPFKIINDPIAQDQERWLAIELDGSKIKVLCVHIPGGTDNKFGADGVGISGKKRKELMWDQVIRFARQHSGDKTILLGDFNTGLPEDAQGTPFALSDYMRVLRLENYVDAWRHLNPHEREFTWYTKRKNKVTGVSEDYNGFRLDYVFVSPALRNEIVDVRHLHAVRTNKISDHAIVLAELSAVARADRTAETTQATESTLSHEPAAFETDRRTELPIPDQPLDSLVAALTKARIAAGNHEFIRRFTNEIGITSYRVIDRPDKPYVVASRRDGNRDLHIFYGYTTGFTSEKEIARLFGAGAGSNVNSPKGTWWVAHPVNRVRPSRKPSRDVRREGPICDCGMQLSVTGLCSSCD
ncbi:endonuclease/exonuclease/phosphatase family protein [Mycolicibacterium mengxianglii]|uniref:endonuclease/exonuclease/phosphatase family protein n=1 Tax=Mycolicibacterium mengxianglii TaxID=2736649 RepID=UPI0018D16C4C|nr:endonuclease/exonuclease/phosphatase family protein [Mycolicibacterium mengxianglii]